MAEPKIRLLVSEYPWRFPKKVEFEYQRRALVQVTGTDYQHHFSIGIDQFNLDGAIKYIAYCMSENGVNPREYAIKNCRKLDKKRRRPLRVAGTTPKLFEDIKSSLDKMMEGQAA